MRDFSPVIQRCRERSAEITSAAPAIRLFHGRGHSYPGFEDLTVDLFAGSLLVACFSADTAGAAWLGASLAEQLPGVTGVVLQARRGRETRSSVVAGEVAEEVKVIEAGLTYLVKPQQNQNVGLFLDMRQTRQWLRERASGQRVLNLFAYTCAFSVAALAGGALGVVNNDMSRRALDWGRRNHQLNGQDTTRVRMLPHDLFRSWGKLRRHGGYDLVVIDPPTNQRGSFVAEKQYSLILKRLPELCRPGAQVVACLNSPFLNADYVPQQMARWCPDCRLLGLMPAAADFPDRYPDRGLKISLFRYEGAGRSRQEREG